MTTANLAPRGKPTRATTHMFPLATQNGEVARGGVGDERGPEGGRIAEQGRVAAVRDEDVALDLHRERPRAVGRDLWHRVPSESL